MLLDGERMRVYADAERAFRVEEIFRLPLKSSEPLGVVSEPFACEVAGERYTPVASICRSGSARRQLSTGQSVAIKVLSPREGAQESTGREATDVLR